MTNLFAGITEVQMTDACGDDPGALCRWIYENTEQVWLAKAGSWLVGTPLTILLLLVGALIVNRLARRGISRIGDRVRAATVQSQVEGRGQRMGLAVDERAGQRADTLVGVLRNVSSVVVYGVVFIMILGELGIDVGPLIASAGIAGVALGFGAQSVVKDFLTGLFMLVEDQFGVGDIIDVGEATGMVERVSLRVTTLRSVDGTVWHVPNGEITRVGNMSQLWSRALLDIGIAYAADVRRAEEVMRGVGHELVADADWGALLKEEPEVLGVEDLAADAVTIRMVIKTEPGEQWRVQRHLRLRIKEALDEAGIEIPFPQRTVWVRNESA